MSRYCRQPSRIRSDTTGRLANSASTDGILLVLHTGMQWNALDGMRIWPCSSAYCRFREWIYAGMFETFLRLRLLEYGELPLPLHR